MAEPSRIQRRRTKGWRTPPDAIYVGRPSRWGNVTGWTVELYRRAARFWSQDPGWLAPLRGHDLACWCPLDQPCHADVILELLANG